MAALKRMSLDEFVGKGYLQEANRQFFHPVGIALMVEYNDELLSYTKLSGVLDGRDDAEGFYYPDEWINTPEAEIKRAFIAEERERFRKLRLSNLGFSIQSVRPRI